MKLVIMVLAAIMASVLHAVEGAVNPTDHVFVSPLDGSSQSYMQILPTGTPAANPDLMIALHGHGSNRAQFATDLRDECRASRDVAAEKKMIYVCPDYRAPTSWMGPAAEADLVHIIGIYRKRGVGRVVLVGASMGGTATLIFTALHPDLVDAGCAMNPMADMMTYAGFSEAIAESYGGTRAQVPDEYRKRSPVLFPEKFAGIPMAFTVGGQDTVVPPDSALRLAGLLDKQPGKNVLLINRHEGGHITTYDDARSALEFAVVRARQRIVRKQRGK